MTNEIKILKNEIKILEKKLKNSKQHLKDICPHINLTEGFPSYYSSDYNFICNDCGMHFVTEDPNFKYNK